MRQCPSQLCLWTRPCAPKPQTQILIALASSWPWQQVMPAGKCNTLSVMRQNGLCGISFLSWMPVYCRLNDDSLFNMDEDVSSRSPSATSPRAQHCGHALLVAKAYALTPAALSSTGLSFASPLSAASLGASMESASAQVTCVKEGWPKQPNSSSSMCMADVRCTGPASYLPDGCYFPATGLKPKHGRTSGRRRRHRVAPTSRLRKSNGQVRAAVLMILMKLHKQ